MSNIRFQQILIIAAIVLLLGFLFTRDVKGLIKPKEEGTAVTARTPVDDNALNIEEVSATSKNLISTELSREITELERKFKTADDNEKLQLARQLSQKWEDVNQPAPSALYLEIIAKKEQSANNWVKSGDEFLKAFDSTQDSLLQPALLQKANQAFTSALALDSANITAKTGLGITIVSGMGAPMEGIQMLLDIVKKDPKNYNANIQLGMFAMKSGQFDKAVTRFKHVITIKETSEAYFYLATALENLGKSQEAITAFLQSKRIAANPTISEFVDKKVVELKK